MSNEIDPVAFGRLLATVDNIEKYLLEVRSDVKTQNSRVYKLEERVAKVEKNISSLPPEIAPKPTVKDKVIHYGVPGAAGGTALAIIYGLVELLKSVLIK